MSDYQCGVSLILSYAFFFGKAQRRYHDTAFMSLLDGRDLFVNNVFLFLSFRPASAFRSKNDDELYILNHDSLYVDFKYRTGLVRVWTWA